VLCRSVRVLRERRRGPAAGLTSFYVKILEDTPEESVVHIDSRPGH